MTNEQFWTWLNANLFQAGMNLQYHQTMAWRWWAFQWGINFLVVLFIVAGIATAANQRRFGKYSLHVSILSAIVASALLFSPISSWQAESQGFQCAWSGVDAQLKDMENTFTTLRESDPLPDSLLNQIQAIEAKKGEIEGREPPPWPGLLDKCYGDQVQRWYGEGVRTYDQVIKKLKSEGGDTPTAPRLRPIPETVSQSSIVR